MGDRIGWYSINEKLETVDHDPVELSAALEIARKYYANKDKKYDSEEQSMPETFFGFARDKDTFIELCVNGPDSVSYMFEMLPSLEPPRPLLKRLFGPHPKTCATLQSWDEIETKITEFFTVEPQEIMRRLYG